MSSLVSVATIHGFKIYHPKVFHSAQSCCLYCILLGWSLPGHPGCPGPAPAGWYLRSLSVSREHV